MAEVTQQQVFDQLRTVNDPELNRDLVTLNMIKKVDVEGSRVRVHIELTTPACPLKDRIKADVEKAVGSIDGVKVCVLARHQPRTRCCRLNLASSFGSGLAASNTCTDVTNTSTSSSCFCMAGMFMSN